MTQKNVEGSQRQLEALGGKAGSGIVPPKFSEPALPHPARCRQALFAELTGNATCRLGDIVGGGHTPVLDLCRLLVAAGCDPRTSLNVYRGDTLALRVRSIAEGARLTVKTAGNGRPIFALEGRQEGAAGPLVRSRTGSDRSHALHASGGSIMRRRAPTEKLEGEGT